MGQLEKGSSAAVPSILRCNHRDALGVNELNWRAPCYIRPFNQSERGSKLGYHTNHICPDLPFVFLNSQHRFLQVLLLSVVNHPIRFLFSNTKHIFVGIRLDLLTLSFIFFTALREIQNNNRMLRVLLILRHDFPHPTKKI